MSKTIESKKEAVAGFARSLESAESVIVATYSGLTVENLSDLRANAKEHGVEVKVMKNTLAKRALAETAFSDLSTKLSGQLIYGTSQEVTGAAKVFFEYSKKNQDLAIQAGAMPGVVLSDSEVVALAKLPSRNELLATLAGTLQAPIAGLARALGELPARLARTMAAVRDQKAAGGEKE